RPAPVTRLSANTDTGATSLAARSSASVVAIERIPAATGRSAATTLPKIQIASAESSGRAISSARKRSRSDCFCTCSFATAAPPTRPGSSRTSRRAAALSFACSRRKPLTSTTRPSRDRRAETPAIAGSRRSTRSAFGASAGPATVTIDGPGRTPVARPRSGSVRKLSERLSWKSLLVELRWLGVAAPNTPATTATTRAPPRIARGRRYASSASRRSMQQSTMPDVHPLAALLPDTAHVDKGELVLGGVRASELARAFGTPVVVYDEETIRASARAYREAAPGALVVYGTKAFPSVAVLELLAAEGVGADVSTAGELAFARRAGIAGDRLVIHGNNKEDELLHAAAAEEALDRARAAGCARFLVRVTPGIEADTHEAIKTAHHGSKFGLPPDDAVELLRRAPECEGLHVHVGSQLVHFGASLMTVDWVGQFAARVRAELDWTPRIVDLGGGLGVRHVLEEPSFTIGEFVAGLVSQLEQACELNDLPQPQLILEPGRSLVARAGVTLYTVGGVKRASAATTYVTVDGGMSDNPRPAMYGARYAALVATRADAEADGSFAVAGKHCESGDVLIERVDLPEPVR